MGQSLAIPRVIPNDWKRLDLIINKIKFRLGRDASPTHAGLTLTGLTASRLIWTNSSKALASKDLIGLVAGTADEINIADDGSGGVTIGIVDPLIVGKGGIGVATLTDHGILLGSGTSAVTPLGVATHGQIPIGSTGADPVLATLAGTTDHISVANGAGSITLDLDTNTRTLLGSFNGIFLEKINFTISESSGTVTGSLEKDGGGDLIQKFSDGYTTLGALTINLTAYVGSNAVPKQVFVYILQSAKTVIDASNSDWPETEHIRIANLLLKDATTTGNDGGALVNRNWNDFAFGSDSQGHITHIENRIRQEPTQWNSGVALTLKNSAGSALITGNSSTAVEIVTTIGTAYQLHKHTFPAFDMYTTGTDDVHIVNQPTDEGGAYETTADLVTDVTHYDDGSASGVAIGGNKYFNLVIWGVQNRSGEASHVMINLPTSQYTTETAAISDANGTSVYDIPVAFKGMGFLIARLTFRLIAGPQWTYIAQEDLRGQIPPISAGVGVTTSDHALLANLDFASAGHTGFQAQGNVLDDLNTLGVVGANSEFLVGTGAGVLAWESGTTVRTSLGLGAGDSPRLTGIELGHASDTTLTRVSAGVVAIEGTNIAMSGGAFHDGFSDSVANEHIDHTGVTLTAGSGLAGGGTIAANRTFDLDINSLTTVAIAAGDFVPFWDITATATNKKILFSSFESTLSHNNLANTHNLTTDISHDGISDVSIDDHHARTHDNTYHSTNYQPLDAELTSLAGLSYAAASFVKMTGANTFALRTIAQTKTDLSLNNVENTALSSWAGTTNITTLGTIATVGNITIANGGTIGQSAGPLLTFDDTNNFLEITGCKTGFGVLTPLALVHISDTTFPQLRVQNDDIDNPAGEGGIRLRSYGNDANTHADISLIGTGTNEGNLVFRVPHTVEQLNISHTGIVVGRAGEPRLNLDYSNDFLEITGCDVVIGGTTAGAKLDVIGGGIRVQGSTAPWPTGSEGLELLYDTDAGVSGEAYIQAYDRAGGSFMPLNLRGSVIRLDQGDVGIGAAPVTKLTVEGTLTLKEQVSSDADTVAYGQIWVDTSNPCLLRFTNDVGGYFYMVVSNAGTGGAGSAGAGNQYVEIEIAGTVYKILHDGTI